MNRKQSIFTLAKIAFAAVMLSWLFHKIPLKLVWGNIDNAFRTEPLLIVTGIAVCWLTVVIAASRWHLLLAAFGIHMPLRTAVCIVQIGQFFLAFLPGPVGDDLTRMMYVSRMSKGRVGEACTTVLLDRCIGLASILLMAMFCIPTQWNILASSGNTRLLAFAITGAGGVVFAGAVLFFIADGAWMQRIVEMFLRLLPAHRITGELSKIGKHVFFHKPAIAKVMAAALFTQFLLCFLFYLAGLAVGIHIPALSWLGFIPVVLAASAIPITPLGAGVREYLVVIFLGVLIPGADPAQAVASSLVAFSMMLAVSLLGGIVYIFYRPAKTDTEAGR